MTLWYDRPATVWMTSALPIGNGELGAMFFGGIESERIQFNEKTLWTGSTTQRGAYQSFGDIYLDFAGHNGSVSNYRQELSLDDAIGRVSYQMDGVTYRREYLASHPDGVIVIRFSTPDARGKISLGIRMEDARDSLSTTIDGCTLAFCRTLELLSYEARLSVCHEGGTLKHSNGKIVVQNADAVTLLLAAGTNFSLTSPTYVGETPAQLHARLKQRLQQASAQSYEALKNTHLQDYQPLFRRVSLYLDSSMPNYTTAELIRQHKESRYLDMLYFQYGRYLMIASSRGMNLPNNLQGIWNDNNTPPWQCDIHTNINIQMNYWPAENCNLSECHLPLLHYIATEAVEKPVSSWQQVARTEGLRGWSIHTQSNIFGYTDWNINRPANAWYCMHLWQHYAYTLDTNYLKQTAFPVMKSACEYWFDRLKPDADNRLIAPDEWSPEQGPWEDGVAYAQQLVWQLFSETMQAVEALEAANIPIDSKFKAELSDKWQRLDNGVHIGSWGQIKEWQYDTAHLDTLGNEHRHISQLIALYPGNQISFHRDSLSANAAKRTLQSRGDYGTGWSRAWKIATWARLLDGNHAYRLLKSALSLSNITVIDMDITKGGVYENLLDSHPPFQIDGNLGATAGIAEMLIQSHQGFIHLLPALPTAWSNGCVKGLRTQQNFTISMKWEKSNLRECSITSHSGRECRILIPKDCRLSRVKGGEGETVRIEQEGEQRIAFPTTEGETYLLTFCSN
ncbi:MAG: glycoside hydrolase family 95 protein [Bacteroides sp.]|nr:glycoside hydrolase family 95 protein [Bacteroides sp.]